MSLPMRLFAIGSFIGAIALSCLLILMPSVGPDKPGFGAILLTVAGFVMLRRVPLAKGRWTFWLFLLPAAAFLLPMVVVVRAFRRLDMVSLLFHAQADMAGAGIEGLETEVLQAVLLVLVLLAATYGLARIWALRKRGLALLAVSLLAINPLTIAITNLFLAPNPKSDLAQRLKLPKSGPKQDKPVDLLMIYIEGTDRQFADSAIWDDVYAPLHEIADQGVAFTRVGQIVGTGWSLAGVVATQCGVPVVPNGLLYNTNFEELDNFEPGVRCLGDVLDEHSYNSIFIFGAKERFAGTDKLFETHGFDQLIGRETLDGMFPPNELDEALIGWMLDDQLVLEAADRIHARLAAKAAPYVLAVETVGPHGSNNMISRHCNANGKSGFSGDLRLALNCTIKDTIDLVTKVRKRQAELRPDRPLLVVLASDHLNHSPAAPQTDPDYAGFNTVIMAGAKLPAGKIVDKPGSMIDVLPTVLQAMGVIVPPYTAGLGVSLLTPETTLVGKYGIEPLEPMVLFDQALSNRIWTAPAAVTAGMP